ncbi:hypothetical protein L7F22_035162 [Adiantum nelumboides]|nr:hypothetical protein [Adiantum nelumboides]
MLLAKVKFFPEKRKGTSRDQLVRKGLRRSGELGRCAAMASSAQLRLMSDLKSIRNEPPEGCSASPYGDENLFVWSATVFGPEDTPWEGKSFKFLVLGQLVKREGGLSVYISCNESVFSLLCRWMPSVLRGTWEKHFGNALSSRKANAPVHCQGIRYLSLDVLLE